MKTIYVDMDGVLSDFEKGYTNKFGISPHAASKDRVNKKFSANWQTFIDDSEFSKLATMPNMNKLVDYLLEIQNTYNYNVAILSSSGGFDNHYKVAQQKMNWLLKHKIFWPAIIVPSKKMKARFADPSSFLIDDTPYNVESFKDAQGHAVLHGSVDNTILKLQDWIYD